MVRIALVVLASLGLGAVGMWLASNFKLRVEPAGGATVVVEPGRLPAPLADRAMRLTPDGDGSIVPASGGQPVSPPAAAVGGPAVVAVPVNRVVITHLLDGDAADLLSWPRSENPLHLKTRKLRLQFRQEQLDATALDLIAFDAVFNNQVVKTFASKAGVCDLDFSANLPEFAGRDRLEIKATRPNPAGGPNVPVEFLSAESGTTKSALTVSLPAASSVVIGKVFNGRFDSGVAKSGTTPIAIFDGYLRVHLQPAAATAEYDFFLFDVAATNVRNLIATGKAVDRKTAGKFVECRVEWDKAPPVKNGLLVVVRERALGNDAHGTDSAIVNVTATPEVPKVEFAASSVKPSSDDQYTPKKAAQVHLLGTEKVDIDVAFVATATPRETLAVRRSELERRQYHSTRDRGRFDQ